MQHLKAVDREKKPVNLLLALEFYHSFQANKYILHNMLHVSRVGYLQIFDFHLLKRQNPDRRVGRRNTLFSS